MLATAVPGIARLLPRPGPWMLWFKQLLAFPLYATVAWLIWVLLQQIAPGDGFLALLGLVLVGFAAWIYGRTRFAEPAGRRIGLGVAATGLAASLAVAATLAPATAPAASGSRHTDGLAYESFGAARLDRLVGRANAGLCQSDRGVVHHLSGQRAARSTATPCAAPSPRARSSR